MKKRVKFFWIMVLAALMLAGVPASAAGTSFPDVPSEAWYSAYVEKISEIGIINGYEDGFFRPENQISRGEFLKLISETAGLLPLNGSPNWSWMSKYWQMAFDGGLLTVDAVSEEILFDVSIESLNMPITRYEMAVIVSNATASKFNLMDGWRAVVTSPSNYIADYSVIPEKYRDAVEQVYGKGIINGVSFVDDVPDGSFCGADTLTRAQAAKVIYLILWSGERQMANFAEAGETVNVQETTEYNSFAMQYRNMTTAERQTALFGNPNKTHFTSAADAQGFMTTVTVPAWKVDNGGNKYASTISLTVHNLVAREVELIFADIFNDDERFPIVTWGGARYTDKLRHSWGCAIDLNFDQNYYCRVSNGVATALVGSGWWPGQNQYSIPADGSVVRAFAKYGWGWGGQGWSGGYYDYMHFSILASGG